MILTWAQLLQPLYVLAFLRGFLMAAIPGGGLTHVAQTGGNGSLATFPGWLAILAALGLGLLGGLDRVQALATPAPGGPVVVNLGGKP